MFFQKLTWNLHWIWTELLPDSLSLYHVCHHCTPSQVAIIPCLTPLLIFLPLWFLCHCQSVHHTRVFVCCFWQITVQCNHLSSPSFSLCLPLTPFLSLCLVIPAKATHWRSFFFSQILLLKSWKPCEVLWLSADGQAQRVVSACWCQCKRKKPAVARVSRAVLI